MDTRVSPIAKFAADELARDMASGVTANRSHFKGEGQTTADQATELLGELKRLDLLEHVAELDIMGLTVIPPEKTGLLSQVDALREALLDVCEKRRGVRPDWQGLGAEGESPSPFGQLESYLGLEHQVFQDFMMNPVILAMATQQLGSNCTLSACQAMLKARGGPELDLHCDELIAPSPYAVHNDSINVTLLLTDYTEDNGALAYVPGSHKYMRRPVGPEGRDQRVKVLAPKGSIVIWPRHTWHGAYVGTAPGMRLTLFLVFSRPHMRTLEDYRSEVTDADLARNPPRFAKLMGRHISYGWKHDGPVLDGSETLIGATPYT